jgi:hypothetical protein
MNQVTVVSSPRTTISVFEVLIGQFAVLHAKSETFTAYDGHIVLRTAAGFVNLSQPLALLTYCEEYTAEVIRPESVLSITVGNETALPLDNLTEEQNDTLRDIRSDNKINAIKRLREWTNVGLRDAKNYIDNL